MSEPSISPISRRRVLELGGGAAVAGLLTAVGTMPAYAAAGSVRGPLTQKGKLPTQRIEEIVQAQGSVTKGVFSIDLQRRDIGEVQGPLGVVFMPSFEINGTLTFQPLGTDLAFLNGDIPLLPGETDGFIDALVANELVFQAFHQHYIETTPNVWFIHFRGLGRPLGLAHAVRRTLASTATPLPQTMPSNPTTPLDSHRLAKILRGVAQVGDGGVVTVNVSRSDRIVIAGVEAAAEANISTEIQFSPLAAHGQAAAAPDFSMTGPEVQPVVSLMRRQGWFVGCLYNQETDESPQLFFSHMLKSGDAYTLATEIRRGLDRTKSA